MTDDSGFRVGDRPGHRSGRRAYPDEWLLADGVRDALPRRHCDAPRARDKGPGKIDPGVTRKRLAALRQGAELAEGRV